MSVRFAAWLALVLLVVGIGAPLLEDCRVECPPGREGDCGSTECCSCCPVARFEVGRAAAGELVLTATAERVPLPVLAPRDADPRGLLHVPKAAL